MIKDGYKLTPAQIKKLDELNYERQASDATLKIAIQYHSNIQEILLRQSREWWKELSEIYGFELTEEWEVKKVNSDMCITKKEKKL